MRPSHGSGHHRRSTVPSILTIEERCAGRAGCEPLTGVQVTWLTRSTRQRVARVLRQKVHVLIIDHIVHSGTVRHERRPTAAVFEISVIEDAVDCLGLRVDARHEDDIVSIILRVGTQRSAFNHALPPPGKGGEELAS
jgi:hypothetical protein